MKKIFLLTMCCMNMSFAATCGSISNAAGKIIKIPCSKPKISAVRAPTTKTNSSFLTRQKELKALVNEIAKLHTVDAALVHAVISVESGYQQEAISNKGAIGLMQLMPMTAQYLNVNPHLEKENIDGGVRYLKEQLERFKRIDLALAAYNSGPQNVIKFNESVPPFAETQEYVKRVMAFHYKYQNDWKEQIN